MEKENGKKSKENLNLFLIEKKKNNTALIKENKL